jgi:hypothetical protein
VDKLILSVSYVAPLLVLAWIWLSQRFGPRFRIAALLLLPLLYGAQWYGVKEMEGWPTGNPVPERFELVAADVREPDRGRDDEGGIYLWVRPPGDPRPRAYRLAYNRALHEMLFNARQRLQQGVRQMGRVQGRESAGNGASIGNALELVVEDAPPIVLPPKN